MAKVPALSSNSTGANGMAIKDEWPDVGSQCKIPDVWKGKNEILLEPTLKIQGF